MTIAHRRGNPIDLEVKVLGIIGGSIVDAEVVNLIIDSIITAVDRVVRGTVLSGVRMVKTDHCVIPQLLLTTTSLTTTLQPANQVTPCSPSRPHYDIRQHSLFCDGTEERFAFHVPINYPSS
ncbi:hypothetical protein TNCV_1378131 [Trichonephila clavipes]|nr:hypothetical protein TNCV_1378131 [Trichonephila clavipes]